MCDFNDIIDKYVQELKNVSLKDFITVFKEKNYNGCDFWFLDYFLSLTDEEKSNKFIIKDEDLIKFGVSLSGRNDNIKKRLDNLELKEGKHYQIVKPKRELTSKGKENSVCKAYYMLTPDAFKLCLLNARKVKEDQGIDPIIYREYYLFIETCINYYNKYQLKLKDRLLSFKDDKIDKLNEKIDQLLMHGSDANAKLDNAKIELDTVNNKLDINTKQLKKVYRKLDKTMELMETVAEDVNPKTHNMQYFVIFRDGDNPNKIYFNFGGETRIKQIKKEREVEEHVVIVDKTYTPGGLSLRSRWSTRISEINNEIIDEIIDEMKEEKSTKKQIKDMLSEYKRCPAIIKTSTSIKINRNYSDKITIKKILRIILEENNVRYEACDKLDEIINN